MAFILYLTLPVYIYPYITGNFYVGAATLVKKKATQNTQNCQHEQYTHGVKYRQKHNNKQHLHIGIKNNTEAGETQNKLLLTQVNILYFNGVKKLRTKHHENRGKRSISTQRF